MRTTTATGESESGFGSAVGPDTRQEGARRRHAGIRWADARASAGWAPSAIAASVAAACAMRLGLGPLGAPALVATADWDAGLDAEVLGDDPPDPGLIGAVYERALNPIDRRRGGVHYTPVGVARHLAEAVVEMVGPGPVCDPAVGGGSFLLGAAEALAGVGVDPSRIVTDLLWGVDTDAAAVMVAEAAVAIWGSQRGRWVVPSEGHLVVADTLESGLSAFAQPPEPGFRLVVGNPPFQSQLLSATARSRDRTEQLRRRWSVDAGPYADSAAFFLLAGCEMLAPGGAMTMVQPVSVLAAGDSAAIRDLLGSHLALRGMWLCAERVFEADVEVCAPILGPVSGAGSVQRWIGADFEELESSDSPMWSGVAASMMGTPSVLLSGPALGEMCTATAGFRDQFYGLAEHTFEAGEVSGPAAPLVTVGMIDPLLCRWGDGRFRFAGRQWTSPVVDLEGLGRASPALRAWVDDRLRPKVLVATQTRVIEVIADPDGRLVPSTPVISVECDPEDVWLLAAALTAPALSALALSRVMGAAMTSDTIKLSASQVLDLPQPSRAEPWREAALMARSASASEDDDSRRACLEALAGLMDEAYGTPAAILDPWWSSRLPVRRRGGVRDVGGRRG